MTKPEENNIGIEEIIALALEELLELMKLNLEVIKTIEAEEEGAENRLYVCSKNTEIVVDAMQKLRALDEEEQRRVAIKIREQVEKIPS